MDDLREVLEIVRLTDVGQRRAHNEDAVASDSAKGLVVLADGMGGYQAGEVASEMAILSLTAELLERLPEPCAHRERAPSRRAEAMLIVNAVKNANEVIYRVSQSQPQCAGMGTTLVIGVFTHNQLLVGHIGDSRMYRLRKQVLKQVTEDHSLLQEQIKSGLITAEQAKYSTNKNLVTRALGVDPEVELELNHCDVEVGDIYLLCSDGLTDMVDDYEIQMTLNQYLPNLHGTAQALVNLANAHGGKDNISVILVRVNAAFEHKKKWYDGFFDTFFSWLK